MYVMKDCRIQFTLRQQELLETVYTLIHDYTKDQADALYELLFELSVTLICHSDYTKQSSSLIYYTGISTQVT